MDNTIYNPLPPVGLGIHTVQADHWNNCDSFQLIFSMWTRIIVNVLDRASLCSAANVIRTDATLKLLCVIIWLFLYSYCYCEWLSFLVLMWSGCLAGKLQQGGKVPRTDNNPSPPTLDAAELPVLGHAAALTPHQVCLRRGRQWLPTPHHRLYPLPHRRWANSVQSVTHSQGSLWASLIRITPACKEMCIL